MRINLIRNTLINVLGNRLDLVVVAAVDVVRSFVHTRFIFAGLLLQVLTGLLARYRALKPAAAATARATATTESLVASLCGLSRCWHTPSVMPHLVVVRVGS